MWDMVHYDKAVGSGVVHMSGHVHMVFHRTSLEQNTSSSQEPLDHNSMPIEQLEGMVDKDLDDIEARKYVHNLVSGIDHMFGHMSVAQAKGQTLGQPLFHRSRDIELGIQQQ
jgi:hypothetical protein